MPDTDTKEETPERYTAKQELFFRACSELPPRAIHGAISRATLSHYSPCCFEEQRPGAVKGAKAAKQGGR